MTNPVVDPGQTSPVVESPVAASNDSGSATSGTGADPTTAGTSTTTTSGTGAAATTEGNTSGTGEPPVTTADPAEPAKPSTKPTTPEWAQKRINDLTARRYEAERQAADAAAKAAAAEARAAELLKKLENPTGAQPNVDPAKPVSIMPEEEIERRAKVKAAEIAAANEFNRACDNIVSAGKKEFKDTWDETVKNLSLVGAVGANANIEFLETAIELQNPHKILKFLGDNLEDAERIVKMPPKKMAMELARIEAAINAPPPVVAAPAAPVLPPVSNAPPPVNPLASGGAKPNSVALDDPSVKMEDWFLQRQKQIDERRRRYQRA